MTFSSTYRQLVLFDCDDDGLSLFKDHKKYLSEIPPNCECCIFWNDFKFPAYKNLKQIFGKYSNISLCPSYDDQIDDSSGSNIFYFLRDLIFKFSFVLLVYRNYQSYKSVFKCFMERYGKKLELYAINKPFSQHLSRIVSQLKTKQRLYSYHENLKELSRNDQLKNKRDSFLSYSTGNYDSSPILCTIEENTFFKRLIKRTQKSIKYYDCNTRLCEPPRFCRIFTRDECNHDNDAYNEYKRDYDNYLSAMCEPVKHSKRVIRFHKIFLQLFLCLKELKHSVPSTQNLDGNLFDSNSVTAIHSFNPFEYQSLVTQRMVSGKVELPIGYQIQTEEESNKSLYYSQPEKCLSRSTHDNFVGANHAASSLSTATMKSNSFFCESTRMMHKTNHAENKTSSSTISYGCMSCAPLIGSTFVQGLHFNGKQAEQHLSTNAELLPSSHYPKVITNDLVPTEDNMQDQEALLTCWECSMKFKSGRPRLTHFIECHFASLPSVIDLSSGIPLSQNSFMSEQLEEKTNYPTHFSESYNCRQCAKDLKSNQRLITHLIYKHAHLFLETQANPLSILQKERAKAHKQSNIVIDETAIIESPLTSSHSPKSFKLTYNCSPSMRSRYRVFIFSTIAQPPNLVISRNTAMQRVKKTQIHSTLTLKSPVVHTKFSEAFRATAPCMRHRNSKHKDAKLSAPVDDQRNKIQPKLKTSNNQTPTKTASFTCCYCSKTFKTDAAHTTHCSTKHRNPNLIMPVNQPGPVHMQINPIRAELNTSVGQESPNIASFICRFCSKTFKTDAARATHCSAKHRNPNIIMGVNQPGPVHMQMDPIRAELNTSVGQASPNIASFTCCYCSKTFKTDAGRISHCRTKHRNPNLIMPVNQPGPVHMQINPIRAELNTSVGQASPNIASFICRFCSKTFKTDAARTSHCSTKHS
ncbi:unnamed protein product [Rotaria socialis]|uniref:C2H2-type domain-containing protein n=3 Tax=Rotaria socialis TaxID=392032 RepID=A0A820CKA3_9BILA|nr:unnamed protein product [Rotaria socialis]